MAKRPGSPGARHNRRMGLFEEFHAWLDLRFPGSRTDDGYSFFVLNAPFSRAFEGGQAQPLIEELVKGRCWLWVVGSDPRRLVSYDRAESRPIVYNPDWNVWEEIPQWLLEGRDMQIDAAGLARRLEAPDLFVVINPEAGLIFDLGRQRLACDKEAGLLAVVKAYPGCFRSEEQEL